MTMSPLTMHKPITLKPWCETQQRALSPVMAQLFEAGHRVEGITSKSFKKVQDAVQYCSKDINAICVATNRKDDYIVHITKKGPPFVMSQLTSEPRWLYLKAYNKEFKSNVLCSMLGAKQFIHKRGRVRCHYKLSKGHTVKVFHRSCEALGMKDEDVCYNCARKSQRLKCLKGEMYYSLSFETTGDML